MAANLIDRFPDWIEEEFLGVAVKSALFLSTFKQLIRFRHIQVLRHTFKQLKVACTSEKISRETTYSLRKKESVGRVIDKHRTQEG